MSRIDMLYLIASLNILKELNPLFFYLADGICNFAGMSQISSSEKALRLVQGECHKLCQTLVSER